MRCNILCMEFFPGYKVDNKRNEIFSPPDAFIASVMESLRMLSFVTLTNPLSKKPPGSCKIPIKQFVFMVGYLTVRGGRHYSIGIVSKCVPHIGCKNQTCCEAGTENYGSSRESRVAI